MGAALGILLLIQAMFGFVCENIWAGKGGTKGMGFLLGFFLGVIGIVIVLLANPGSSGATGARCPYCAEFVQPTAQVCRHCGRNLPVRACPNCNTQIVATAERCPNCRHRSSSWRLHDGHWWKREGGVDYWYDDDAKTWQPFRA